MDEATASSRCRRSAVVRVAFVLEIPTPYRNPLIDRIAELEDVELRVFYCAPTDPLRNWSGHTGRANTEVLPGLSVGGRRGGLTWKLNPGVIRRLDAFQPEVVVVGGYAHFTMQLTMVWAQRRRTPYILVSETTDLTPRNPWRVAIKGPVVKLAVGNASAFLSTGSDSRDYLTRWGGDPSRMFLFPNAPDVERIADEVEAVKERAGELKTELRATGSPLFLYLGRLVVQKNVEVLVRAMERVQQEMPDAGLLIAGDGPLRSELHKLALDLRVRNVTFAGPVEPGRVPEVYAVSDAFVLPSFDEPWGVVVQEAMAARLPVLVSDRVGCARDLVEEGVNGYLFSHSDPADLAAKLLDLKEEPVRKKMGDAGARIVRDWDYERCVRSFQSAIRIACGN